MAGGSFLDQLGLSFGHSFRYVCFFQASIHFDSQSFVDEREFLKPESIIACYFPIWYFFECCSEWMEVYFCLRAFFESLSIFFHYYYYYYLIFSFMFDFLLSFSGIFTQDIDGEKVLTICILCIYGFFSTSFGSYFSITLIVLF